ncbi:MAG: hypothetical protein AAFX40_11895 [Cyanobacteria bacterium J06639_1]
MNALLTTSILPPWYRVPREIANLLLAAVATWEDTTRSEHYILQALQHPETNLEVLVSAYRYFFYKNNDRMARRLALQVMEHVKQAESLPDDWDKLRTILRDRRSDPSIRLYLSAYTALGILVARWGAFQAAIDISTRICSVDLDNEFGAELILSILTAEDEED